MRRNHVRRRLTAIFCGDMAECADHLRNGEQTPVLRNDTQEIADQARNPGLVENGADRLQLVVSREHGALDETLQVVAAFKKFLEAVEVSLDCGNRLGFLRQFKKRTSVAPCHSGNHGARLCHGMVFSHA